MREPESYLAFVGPDEIRIKGHRIGIESVLIAHLEEGMTVDQLRARFPTLAPEEIEAVLEYHRQHRSDVDAYLQTVREHEDRVFEEAARNPSPAARRLSALRDRSTAEARLPGPA